MLKQNQIHNFNAGPSALTPDIRAKISTAIESIDGGPGILELSHRSKTFDQIIEQAKQHIECLYELPSTHEVLFLQGGASLQFAMLPYNLGTRGGFVTTGEWSRRAFAEACLLQTNEAQAPLEIHSEEAQGFCAVPKKVQIDLAINKHHDSDSVSKLDYLHVTSNNTIFGTQYNELPILVNQADEAQINPGFVIDASSDLFSKKVDWSKVDLLYGGAQKNAGPAGVTIVIGRRSILRSVPQHPFCPKILAYQTHAEKGSLYHTPNTLGIYAVGAVAEWLCLEGGLDMIAERSHTRAQKIYDIIDHYSLYEGHAQKDSRSLMNLTFRTTIPEAEQDLLVQAQELNIYGLKGHRSVGGLRASLYNAVADESIDILADLLTKTAQKFGA